MTPEWLIHRGSPSTRWPSLRTCRFQQLGQFSTEDHSEDKRRVLGQILAEMTERLQPLQDQSRRSATPHQHKRVDVNVAMVITIMFCSRRQANMLPTKPLQDHNVVSTIASTGAFEDCPEEEPPMTIKNCSARTTVRASLKTCGKDTDKHAGASFQNCREEEAKCGHDNSRGCGSKEPMRFFVMDGVQRQLSASRRHAS